MTVLVIVILGVLIGLVLGGLGGGGAALTVPALVYIVGQPPQNATTSSLVIVGLTALVGVVTYVTSGRVAWKTAAGVVVAGIPTALVGTFLNRQVDGNYLLIGFSVLRVFAAIAMVRQTPRTAAHIPRESSLQTTARSDPRRLAVRARSAGHPAAGTAILGRESQPDQHRGPSWGGILATGSAVGLLTGFFGVGGGFVIVPALVLVLGIPMQMAVGTSLLVVAANSATALTARAGTAHFDWTVIAPFTIAAMAATVVGKRGADRLPARTVKLYFAVLLILVALYTAGRSIAAL